MSEIKTAHDRLSAQANFVVKANALIQKSRYSLTLTQQKQLLYIISKIKPTDNPETEYTFNARDFCRICNLEGDTKGYLTHTSKAFDDIGRLVITIDEGDRLIKSHWFNEMVYDKKTDTFTVSFGKNITPYLFQLHRLYTQYSLETVLAMKSKYAIRLYELLLSYRNMRIKQVYSIDELKELLDCNTYKTFQHLQSRVLIPAIEDINSLTDIKVRYDTLKEGRRIVAIEFTVSYNADTHADNFLRRHMLLGGREKP